MMMNACFPLSPGPPPIPTVRTPAEDEISTHSFILELNEASNENGKIRYYLDFLFHLSVFVAMPCTCWINSVVYTIMQGCQKDLE